MISTFKRIKGSFDKYEQTRMLQVIKVHYKTAILREDLIVIALFMNEAYLCFQLEKHHNISIRLLITAKFENEKRRRKINQSYDPIQFSVADAVKLIKTDSMLKRLLKSGKLVAKSSPIRNKKIGKIPNKKKNKKNKSGKIRTEEVTSSNDKTSTDTEENENSIQDIPTTRSEPLEINAIRSPSVVVRRDTSSKSKYTVLEGLKVLGNNIPRFNGLHALGVFGVAQCYQSLTGKQVFTDLTFLES